MNQSTCGMAAETEAGLGLHTTWVAETAGYFTMSIEDSMSILAVKHFCQRFGMARLVVAAADSIFTLPACITAAHGNTLTT
jgi:hypothetical protein